LETYRMSMTTTVAEPQADPRAPRRVRHQPRRRELTVQRVDKIAAHMVRVTLGGDLDGFSSLGFDDHVKLFFPTGRTGADGEPEFESRDYTPRRYDPVAQTLDVEFVIHDAGPATRWAEQAAPGQRLRIGGPRGSRVVPFAFDWHLMIGDDTALPAIARRLEEMPPGTRAVVLVEVDNPADRVPLGGSEDVSVTWVYRNGGKAGSGDALSQALEALQLPKGDYYAWVACESLTAKALRAQLIGDCGANPRWMRAAGYWRAGAAAVHDEHSD
jgi:NADPH-dependent ferric siderophore reductase